ncbi:MAG: hypothetical protein JXN59_10550 [Anaerolineae bacterium]|nr:hypothetical protein [Anaerolineae bacterium]
MAEQPEQVQPVALLPEPAPEEETRDPNVTRIIMWVVGALMLLLVVGFGVALVLALASPGAAAGVQIVRDFFIIALALEGMLMGAALIVLVLQIARLTNLLQNEIKPILEQTNDTVRTVKGTANFVSRNVAEPVIKASGFVAWLGAFLRELFGVFRAGK